MFSSLFWLLPTIFRTIEPEESLSLSGYQNATSIETLVANLQAELVPRPIAYPMKTFHTPPHARKNAPLHPGENVSLNPAAVLGPRQTCTANNYCFANNPTSYCPNCGICCTQASGGWCCTQTGTFCCNGENGGSGGCCDNGAICTSTGCILPTVTVTSTYTSWSTLYDYVTQYSQYIQTVYQTVTVSSSTTIVVPPTGGAKMVKRTSAIDESPKCGPTATHRATSEQQPTHVEELPQILIATILSSPNYDLVELKLQEMGLLVKRVATITSTVTVTASATTTLISSIYVTTTSVTTGLTTITALVTFTSTSSGAKTSPTGNPVPVSSPGSTTSQNSASGLSTGAKAGIGVASAAGSAIICILLIFWWRHRSKKENEGSTPDVAGAGVGTASTPATTYEPKFQNSPQSQSPSYSQYAPMYPQQHQGGGGGYLLKHVA